MATPNGEDDQVYVAILILLCGIVVIGLLGPIGLLVAGATITIGAIAGLGQAGGALVTLVGAGTGMVLVDPTDWLMGPMKDMAEIYRVYLFDGWTWDTDGLWTYYGKLLAHGPAWSYFSPLGVFAGGITITAWQLYWSSPLRRTARGKPPKTERPSWRTWWTTRSMPRLSAAVGSGTFMGIDKMTGRHIEISDADANTHSLVLGTPGSGKTVSVLNLVESAIHRKLPVVYIDGKGDYGLASTITAYARAQGRPAYLFAMRGESCRYNPLVAGDYSAKKDRIIELRDWSEDHYRKLAEGYLQTVFKVLAACEIETDLITLADYMSVKALSTLIRERTDQIGDEAKALALEVNEQQAAEPHVESLRAEIRNIARSEIGHLFKLPAEDKVGDDHHDGIAVSVLELPKAIEEGAVVCFCLPTLQFPSLAKVLGKIVINDFKAVADAQLGKAEAERRPMYAIFDEFSVFAGEQVLNVINMGRSAGVHAVLATQSVADLGRATPETPDHFIRQVVSSCNNYLVHRLNAPEDAKMVAELIGTKDGIEHTAQIDGMGATGLGSVHRAKTFIVHPDEIKQLPRGQAIFVNKTIGTIQRVKVRLGRIAS